MRARSLKTQRLIREYRQLVPDFLQAHPVCEFPLGCRTAASVVHHRRGRFGRRLLDQRWWAASCNTHNLFAETETGRALEIGWLVRIEGQSAA